MDQNRRGAARNVFTDDELTLVIDGLETVVAREAQHVPDHGWNNVPGMGTPPAQERQRALGRVRTAAKLIEELR